MMENDESFFEGVKDLVLTDRASRLNELWQVLDDCWIFLKLFPKFGTMEIGFPPQRPSFEKICKDNSEAIKDSNLLDAKKIKLPPEFKGRDILEEPLDHLYYDDPGCGYKINKRSFFRSVLTGLDMVEPQIANGSWENVDYLKILQPWCHSVGRHCLVARYLDIEASYSELNVQDSEEYLAKLEFVAHMMLAEGNRLIGYWTAKTSEKIRNKRNVSVYSNIRKDNKVKLTELLINRDFKTDREFWIRAQSEIDRGERTVKNMVKEILQEHNK